MRRVFHSILLTVLVISGCKAQFPRTEYEPVRYEDGTPVTDDPDAEALFAQDRFQVDTTLTGKGDTLFVVRHESAYVRMQLEGLPADAGIDRITLVPMEGEVTVLPISIPATGAPVVWMAKGPGRLPATAAIAQGTGGRLWSVRLPGMDLKSGTAYRWTGTCLTPDAPPAGLRASLKPQTYPPEIEAGEYSGITWLDGSTFAVVDDNLRGGGIVLFSIPIDDYGDVGSVSMRLTEGTSAVSGKKRDCEGIAFVPGKSTLYVSSEKHQEILEYDLAGKETGHRLQVPKDLGTSHIVSNRGFEALTFNAKTGLFWTTTESPLRQDTFLPRILRLQSFDIDGKPAGRYLYRTEEPEIANSSNAQAYVFGIPTLAALDDGRLIVLEREVYVPKGGVLDKLRSAFTRISLFVVDPVHDEAGILRKAPLCSFRTSALDLANYEGMCLGPTLPDGRRTLVLIADSQKGSGGLTKEYVKVILLQ